MHEQKTTESANATSLVDSSESSTDDNFIGNTDRADGDGELRGQKALWRAVLAQSVMDAKSRSSKQEAFYYRHTAEHFLFEDNRDFRTVCDLADFNPDWVRRKLRESRDRGFKWRAGDGEQPTRYDRVAQTEGQGRSTHHSKQRILAELGLFTSLPRYAPVKPRTRRSNHIQALQQFSTQIELGF